MLVGCQNKKIKKEHVYGEFISKSSSMKKIFDIIEKVSRTSSNVLITGESGTGKELVARAIHSKSNRKDKAFIAINCGAIPAELMESELFGHEKGAFTGAVFSKLGKFEYADGGSILLDEISTLPMHMQIKLLRVLQEKSFEKIGSNKSINVDIRFIAATNINLDQLVNTGKFREDLYYRLKVIPMDLPPLRERKEDIPLLVYYFLKKYCKIYNKHLKNIAKHALATFSEYSWPGNIRELENLIEYLVVTTENGGQITKADISSKLLCLDSCYINKTEESGLKAVCRNFERKYIYEILNKTNWNVSQAAKIMKIHRNTILTKMKMLGIKNFK